jgi:hypothetical protein
MRVKEEERRHLGDANVRHIPLIAMRKSVKIPKK